MVVLDADEIFQRREDEDRLSIDAPSPLFSTSRLHTHTIHHVEFEITLPVTLRARCMYGA